MSCEYETLSFCTLFSLTVASLSFWNFPFIVKVLKYGENIGDFVAKESKVTVNSTLGTLNLPIVSLPSYDWTVGFFVDETISDGLNRPKILESILLKTECRIYRNK